MILARWSDSIVGHFGTRKNKQGFQDTHKLNTNILGSEVKLPSPFLSFRTSWKFWITLETQNFKRNVSKPEMFRKAQCTYNQRKMTSYAQAYGRCLIIVCSIEKEGRRKWREEGEGKTEEKEMVAWKRTNETAMGKNLRDLEGKNHYWAGKSRYSSNENRNCTNWFPWVPLSLDMLQCLTSELVIHATR